MVEGWLFDAYPLREKIVFWIKQDNGDTIRLEDIRWSHSIYVASDDKLNLKSIVNRIIDSDDACLVKDYEFTSRYETIIDKAKSEVLKLTLSDSAKASALARRIETINGNNIFGRIRLYNVDLLPEQSYFYGHDIFPLAFCEVHDNNHPQLRWDNKDDVWASDYKIPGFKIIHLDLNLKKKGKKIPKYTDKIDTISIT